MNTIIIHGLWFICGAACMFVVMVAIAPVMLSSRISRWQKAFLALHTGDDWTPPEYAQQAMNRELLHQAGYSDELAEAKATARFYQELYLDEQRAKAT